jgi:tetratricopeptide (TPR) repeat protein
MAKIYSNFGALYGNSNQFKWAMDYYKKSLQIYTNLKDDFQISTVTNNLGLLLSKMGNKNEALENYQKAFEIRKRL